MQLNVAMTTSEDDIIVNVWAGRV